MSATDPRFIEVLDAARALVPQIAAFQPEIEESRCIPTALVGKLREAGLYRLMVPRERGGLEVDPLTALRVLEVVAEGDGATAWNLHPTMIGQTFMPLLPADGVAEIYASGPDVILSGTTAPFGGHAMSQVGGG